MRCWSRHGQEMLGVALPCMQTHILETHYYDLVAIQSTASARLVRMSIAVRRGVETTLH